MRPSLSLITTLSLLAASSTSAFSLTDLDPLPSSISDSCASAYTSSLRSCSSTPCTEDCKSSLNTLYSKLSQSCSTEATPPGSLLRKIQDTSDAGTFVSGVCSSIPSSLSKPEPESEPSPSARQSAWTLTAPKPTTTSISRASFDGVMTLSTSYTALESKELKFDTANPTSGPTPSSSGLVLDTTRPTTAAESGDPTSGGLMLDMGPSPSAGAATAVEFKPSGTVAAVWVTGSGAVAKPAETGAAGRTRTSIAVAVVIAGIIGVWNI